MRPYLEDLKSIDVQNSHTDLAANSLSLRACRVSHTTRQQLQTFNTPLDRPAHLNGSVDASYDPSEETPINCFAEGIPCKNSLSEEYLSIAHLYTYSPTLLPRTPPTIKEPCPLSKDSTHLSL